MKIRKRNQSKTTPATAALSRFLSSTSFPDIPSPVIDHASNMVLDTIGVSLGAVGTEPIEIVRSLTPDTQYSPSTDQNATIIGYGATTNPRNAAFLNGILANALDFDDLHQRMGGHPSSPILPVALALGEQNPTTGKEFITAFIAGVEVETTLGKILNPGHYERGWHPTAVYGHLGATATAGVLLGLTEAEFRTAFGIATSQAGGSKANLGSMTKPYHIGNAARAGIEAAQLAAAGFTARETTLEDEFGGFCDLFKGDTGYHFNDHLAHLGDPWAILDPPVVFKPYPCCASAHAAIDCALALKQTHTIEPSIIDSVTVTAHPRRLQHTDDPNPANGLEGKISTQYVVARALIRGDVWIDDFTHETFATPTNQEVMNAIQLQRDDERFEPNPWGAHISIETTDGAVVEHAVTGPKGSVMNPMTPNELQEKFTRCASNVLSKNETEQALRVLSAISTAQDIYSVIECITPSDPSTS